MMTYIYGYNIDTRGLSDIYTRALRPVALRHWVHIRIRQTTPTHVITYTYAHVYNKTSQCAKIN